MCDEKALAWEVRVPTALLTVLEHIELITLLHHFIGLAPTIHRLQVRDRQRPCDLFECEPSQETSLEGGIVGWAPAPGGVVSSIHEIPLVNLREIVPTGRIDIRQTQTMGILVTEGADATGMTVEPLLGTDTELVDFQFLCDLLIIKHVGVGPYIFGEGTISTISTIARHDEGDLLYRVIAVPVVWREVDMERVDCLFHGLPTGGLGIEINVLCRMAHLHRTNDIELSVELSSGLVTEIVGGTPYPTTCVATRHVEQLMVVGLGIAHAECHIGILHEDDSLTIDAQGVPVLIERRQAARGGALSHALTMDTRNTLETQTLLCTREQSH